MNGNHVSLSTATYATALTIMCCWLLWIGQSLILPLLVALIVVYVLTASATGLGRLPLLRHLPRWMLTTAALIGFALIVFVFFAVLTDNLTQIAAAMPRYEENLDQIVSRMAFWLRIEDEPNWARVRQATFDQIDFRAWIGPTLSAMRGLGTTLFLVVLYAGFMLMERHALAGRLAVAIRDPERRSQVFQVIARINDRIGRYLGVKTLVNAILGGVSYLVMVSLGIEFAAFWAILIGLLNYIPYVGSVLGVLFPVLLAMAQTGSFATAGTTAALLTLVQVIIGSIIEPRMMGRAFNLSPLVVLMAVAFWATLWGAAGAVLAVPLTASFLIVLGEFPRTRPWGELLSGGTPSLRHAVTRRHRTRVTHRP
ncbi:AI-2E family transporter [uncultured Paracoccus sp.]|uniref:AI-2E family transporter n=1 Tax=uncultured Paracoccus sp. TaxID=189685 RepID=UPI0026023408|nr:AI-2E family transporter [uncultured Paracoccus sp.]